MLSDQFAEQELKRILKLNFQEDVGKIELLGYDPQKMLQAFNSFTEKNLGRDHLNEFQNFIDYNTKIEDQDLF